MNTEQAELLIRGAKVYNSYFKNFVVADVSISDGKFFYIDPERSGEVSATKVVDAEGMYMVPGLIDIHMHIESAMLTPGAFCKRVAECGVTTIVSEPHEMANVNGMQGILDMIKAGEDSPIDVFYGISSCVPSTSTELETTGGIITCAEMEKLKENPWVSCIGEVMNYRTVIHENDLEITKFIKKIRAKDRMFPIEGHCPVLVGLDLAKYLCAGINSDHTEHTIEELKQRFFNGMFVEIQEKMLKKEVLDFIKENNLQEHFSFVTDDVMPDTLCKQGQVDALVRSAIMLGMTPEDAIYNATFTSARRMNLLDRGAIAPGKIADFVLLSDLNSFEVESTYKDGQLVWQKGVGLTSQKENMRFPEPYYHSIHLPLQDESRFEVRLHTNADSVSVRAMQISDGSTKTTQKIVTLPVKDGVLQWENSGYLLAAVFDRYGKTGGVGFGLLCGDCHKRGAVATSYAHDCHNLLVAGATARDMQVAVNRVIELQGGIVAVDDGEVKGELPLPVGGILSDLSAQEAAEKLATVRDAMISQGYKHYNPFMSFCTLTLPVSPALKLTDKGLIDVKDSKLVPLVVEA